MKQSFTVVILVAFLALTAGIAMADSIQGRLGVTGRIGFLVPSDSEATVEPFRVQTLNTDVGFVGGGGLIYGINRNFAAELDITYTDFDANLAGFNGNAGDFSTTNIALGLQYRFVDLPMKKLVPYVGAGMDILVNNFNSNSGANADVDTVVGGHISGGVDYFLLRQLALTAELKGVLAPNADINFGGEKVGNYDPTNFSMTFGVRYFFY